MAQGWMRRYGAWTGAAALVLLGAAALRSTAWNHIALPPQSIALDLRGIVAVDIGSSSVGSIAVLDGPASLEGAGQRPPRITRSGDRLHVEVPADPVPAGSTSLHLTPTVKSITGRQLKVRSQAHPGMLRIESRDLDWDGNAEALYVRASEWPQEGCLGGGERIAPNVTIHGGNVGRMKISIERGSIDLQDLAQVEHLELDAGPDVKLTVARFDDLRRIELRGFDGEPTPPPEGAGALPVGGCVDIEAVDGP
jgi:hypothetical protein